MVSIERRSGSKMATEKDTQSKHERRENEAKANFQEATAIQCTMVETQ